jgi:CBS domain-containing protein
MRLRELPPRPLLTVEPQTSLAEVARILRAQDGDSVAVMHARNLLGIITEHDLVSAIADGVDPHQATAELLMSTDPVTVSADEEVSVVAVRMITMGIRHLPVVDAAGVAVGIVSARDLVTVLDTERASGTDRPT